MKRFYTGDTIAFTTHAGEDRHGTVKNINPETGKVLVYTRATCTANWMNPNRLHLISRGYKTPAGRKGRPGIPVRAIKEYPFCEIVGGNETGATRHRVWGLLRSETEDEYIIQLYDGGRLFPEKSKVSIYAKPPENWKELFKQQQRITTKPKRERCYNQYGFVPGQRVI